MSYGLIYLITNAINGKVYVGQTTSTVNHRWGRHCTFAKRGSKDCPRFYNAIRKYGPVSFTVQTVQEAASQEELDRLEIEAIKKYNSTDDELGYNITVGGCGSGSGSNHPSFGRLSSKRGIPLSEETKQKISRSRTGIGHSKETVQKIIVGLQNRIVKDSTREKLAQGKIGKKNPMFGVPHSEAHRKHMQELMKSKVWVLEPTTLIRKRVPTMELEQYLAQGWVKGKGKNGSKQSQSIGGAGSAGAASRG